MRVIGITGGVGAGKSTIVGILQKHYTTEYLHCDAIAHELMEQGGSAHEELLSLFGEDLVNADGTLNRSKLYERAFLGDRVEELNACVHPKVRIYVEERIANLRAADFEGMVLIEAALLIEAGYKDICDELWYIHAPAELRRARLKANRGYSDERVDSIMAEQASEALFFSESDFVLYNDSSQEECEEHIVKQVELHFSEMRKEHRSEEVAE
ncbi:MAG: dephospho-CoA kinase [Lachnospiraceae bacterium]|nr:dephospho-CoA kinase [Lachnospiraceae bacterium]MBQ8547547.1 dephospho-CoA kinase [Lachnospiraceae bacterium]